jgi:transposase InsO family protein
MGHLSQQNLKKLSSIADGMEATKPDGNCICEACVLGRQTQRPHKGHLPRGRHKMDIIHTDVAYSPITSFDGKKYFVTMIDDFTQHGETKAIAAKSDAPQMVQQFITDNSTPEQFTTLIIQDRGGENLGSDHTAWLRSRGITMHNSDTEQHQQNGVAEAFNKTIEHKLQSSLQGSGLDVRHWSWIIEHHTAYVRNRSPCRRLHITPYEAWTGQRPNLSNIRKLGSRVYVHKLQQEQQKLLGTKTKEQRLLGMKGRSHYLVTTENPKQPAWRFNCTIKEDHPNCTSLHNDNFATEENDNDSDDEPEQLPPEPGGTIKAPLQAPAQSKRSSNNNAESPSKRTHQRSPTPQSPLLEL